MFQHTTETIDRAERLASRPDASAEDALAVLRDLALEEFGELMLSLPNKAYPSLSRLLPAMAPESTQKTWTGSSGHALHRQTASFVRQLEVAYARVHGESLRGKTILDFGVGYGRIMRLLYYFSNPRDLWGVDAWEKSLTLSRSCGMLGNFAQSERVPDSLPVGDTRFDLAYALSVFTHLSPQSADACLSAVRGAMKPGGVFVATVRPVEFWPYLDQQRGLSVADQKTKEHLADGYAYLPHAGAEGETYGDASYSLDWFARPGWRLAGYDWSRVDSYQLAVILEAI